MPFHLKKKRRENSLDVSDLVEVDAVDNRCEKLRQTEARFTADHEAGDVMAGEFDRRQRLTVV